MDAYYDFFKVKNYTNSYNQFKLENETNFKRILGECRKTCSSINLLICLFNQLMKQDGASQTVSEIVSNLREHARQLQLVVDNVELEEKASQYFDLSKYDEGLQSKQFTKLYAKHSMSMDQVKQFPQGNFAFALRYEIIPPMCYYGNYDKTISGILPREGDHPKEMSWMDLSDHFFEKGRNITDYSQFLSAMELTDDKSQPIVDPSERHFVDEPDLENTFKGKLFMLSPGLILHMFANRVENACVFSEERKKMMRDLIQLLNERANTLAKMKTFYTDQRNKEYLAPYPKKPYPIMFLVDPQYEDQLYQVHNEHRSRSELPLDKTKFGICAIATTKKHIKTLREFVNTNKINVDVYTFENIEETL